MSSRASFRFRVAAAVGAAVAAGAALASACGPGSIGDLTSGRGTSTNKPADLCPGRAIPPPAPADAGDSTSIPDFTLAVDSVRVDVGDHDSGVPLPLGLDLDKTCDCAEKPSCRGSGTAPVICEPEGRDNVAGRLLGDISHLIPGLEPSLLTRRINEGAYSLLLTIEEWNGTDNDPRVIIMFRLSPGLSRRDWDGGFGTVPYPNFDGNDIWEVDPASLYGGALAYDAGTDCTVNPCVGTISTSAWVNNGKFVANFSEIPITLNTSDGLFTLPFSGVVVTGRVTNTGALRRFEGELTGRLDATRLLKGATTLRNPADLSGANKPFCPDTVGFDLYRKQLCDSADISRDPNNDGKDLPCDAVSEAISLTAVSAKLGVIKKTTQETSDCAVEPKPCN